MEQTVRRAGEAIEKELNDSISNDMDCEVSSEHMNEMFGKFAQNPSDFHFERGEVQLIKELVAYVKHLVDKNGENSGLDRFKYKQPKQKKANRHRNKKPSIALLRAREEKITNHSTENLLLETLLARVLDCFVETKIQFDIERLDLSTVEVCTVGGQIYGKIKCILCEDMNENMNTNRNTMKRVSYDSAGAFWIMSNFQTHLRRTHKLKSTAGKSRKSRESKPVNDDNELLIPVDPEDSVILIDTEPNQTVHVESIDADSLYKQFAEQIGKMLTLSLSNSEETEKMNTEIGEKTVKIDVASIDGDGNCLFASIAHQMHQHPINSHEHRRATKLLRQKVVDHIIAPENFERYVHVLKDRVYAYRQSLGQTNKIPDIETECKSFVRNVLVKENQRTSWGGFESIKAASEIYGVNIITCNEEGPCGVYPQHPAYEKTIVIAWRVGYYQSDGKEIRNHYDSVVDMAAEDIIACTDFLMRTC